MASDSDKKKLTELRVIDLRAELENRGLDKNGVKAVLIERLQKVLKEEGHDPDEYYFDLSEKKPSKRSSVGKRGDHDTESETHSNADENHDISFDAGENDDVDTSVNSVDDKKRILDSHISDENVEVKSEIKSEPVNSDFPAIQVKEEPPSPIIKTEKEEMEVDTCFAPSIKEMENAAIEKAASESNAVDNEDSINLTIGEEEEKLLAEEEDSSCHGKETKDASEVRDNGRAGEAKSSESKADAASSGGADRDGVNGSGASAGGEGSGGAANLKEDDEEGRVNRGHKESEDGAERSKDEEEKRQQTDGPSSSAPAASERADGSEGGEGGVGDEEGKSGVSRKEERAGEKGKSGAASKDSKSPVKDDKDKKGTKGAAGTGTAVSSRNLWVSGLSSSTRATDLKQVFSKYGKVIGAKVVTNARTPGARCYGYVTMATSDDASRCIQHLHRTELHGRMISVERAKGDSSGPPKKSSKLALKKAEEKKRHEKKGNGVNEKLTSPSDDKKKDDAKKSGGKEDAILKEKNSLRKLEMKRESRRGSEKSKSREMSRERRGSDRRRGGSLGSGGGSRYRPHSSRSRTRSRSPYRGRPVPHDSRGVPMVIMDSHVRHHHHRSLPVPSSSSLGGVLTFAQIRDERERQRLRERERELREEERRRREEMARQRDIEKRQREEAIRLEREREKLRLDRERIERERAELIRLETERQRLEREKLEREREELRRQQMRFNDNIHFEEPLPPPPRRAVKRPAVDDRRDPFYDESRPTASKRAAPPVDRRYDPVMPNRYDESPNRPSRYDSKREFRRENEYGRETGGASVPSYSKMLPGSAGGSSASNTANNYDRSIRRSGASDGYYERREGGRSDLHRRDSDVPVSRDKDDRYDRNGSSSNVVPGSASRDLRDAVPSNHHHRDGGSSGRGGSSSGVQGDRMHHHSRERYHGSGSGHHGHHHSDSGKGNGRYSDHSGENWRTGGPISSSGKSFGGGGMVGGSGSGGGLGVVGGSSGSGGGSWAVVSGSSSSVPVGDRKSDAAWVSDRDNSGANCRPRQRHLVNVSYTSSLTSSSAAVTAASSPHSSSSITSHDVLRAKKRGYPSPPIRGKDRWVSGSGVPIGVVGHGSSGGGVSSSSGMYNPSGVGKGGVMGGSSAYSGGGGSGYSGVGDRFDSYKNMGPLRKY